MNTRKISLIMVAGLSAAVAGGTIKPSATFDVNTGEWVVNQDWLKQASSEMYKNLNLSEAVTPGVVTEFDQSAKHAGLAQRAFNKAQSLTLDGFGITQNAAKSLTLNNVTLSEPIPSLVPLVGSASVGGALIHSSSTASQFAKLVSYAGKAKAGLISGACAFGMKNLYDGLNQAEVEDIVPVVDPAVIVGLAEQADILEAVNVYQPTPSVASSEVVTSGYMTKALELAGNAKNAVAGYLTKDAIANGAQAIVDGYKNNTKDVWTVAGITTGIAALASYSIYQANKELEKAAKEAAELKAAELKAAAEIEATRLKEVAELKAAQLKEAAELNAAALLKAKEVKPVVVKPTAGKMVKKPVGKVVKKSVGKMVKKSAGKIKCHSCK